MSNDPFASGSEVPPEYGPDAQPASSPTQARQRVQAPAIALIVVGILNLLMALVQVTGTIWIAVAPQQIQKMMEDMQKGNAGAQNPFKDLLGGQGQQQIGGPASVIQNTVLSLLMVLIAVLNLIGGIFMLSLRSYALSIVGAISAAIPCLSCGGCCLFGEVIGIWALVVLVNNDVRSAFQ
jgi:hypothetical protein